LSVAKWEADVFQKASRLWHRFVEFTYKLQGAHRWGWTAAERDITLPDGRTFPKGAYIMTRRANGKWEYRACTPDELKNAIWMNAIR
jgi:hypothetical protein